MTEKKELTKLEAKKLCNSKFWEKMTPKEIAEFQINTPRLCMPFDVFHKAVSEALERKVWNHELFMSRDAIIKELAGEKEPPSFEEIVDLLPMKHKTIVTLE